MGSDIKISLKHTAIKIGHNKQGYVVVSIMQNFIGFD
jgi:hypothetical protein